MDKQLAPVQRSKMGRQHRLRGHYVENRQAAEGGQALRHPSGPAKIVALVIEEPRSGGSFCRFERSIHRGSVRRRASRRKVDCRNQLL